MLRIYFFLVLFLPLLMTLSNHGLCLVLIYLQACNYMTEEFQLFRTVYDFLDFVHTPGYKSL